MMQRNELSPDVERLDAIGKVARAAAGQRAYALDVEQQCCGGLNFGYFYDRSPIIAYDGERAPGYTMGTFTSTTVPGCRVPHVRVEGRRSLYDAMGPDYTLLRLDPAAHVAAIVAAAAQRMSPPSWRRPRSAAFPLPFSTWDRVRHRSSIAASSCLYAPTNMWRGSATMSRLIRLS
jgi:hypothetical protein